MEEAGALTIVSSVARSYRTAIQCTAEQLSSCLSSASRFHIPVHVHDVDWTSSLVPTGSVLIATLVDEIEPSHPLAEVERRWRERFGRAQDVGHERILLCSLFRHVAPCPKRPETLERIRRLNRLVIGLSRDIGVEVVDIDRLLALCGARTVGADHARLSVSAAKLAGHAIAATVLNGDLGGRIRPDAQARAMSIHGGVHDIEGLVERHLEHLAAR